MVGRRLCVFRSHESSVDDASRLEPRLLQAGQRSGPSLGLTLEQQADKVLGGHAHSLEVVLREAEVQTADVQTRLLQALVQEGRSATQDDICHYPCKPAIKLGKLVM